MKHLMTLVALLVSTAAVAQIPTLPWNPDGNDDQFIGLPDLLDLLTVYGQEFQNAIVAEDGESAILEVGTMTWFECQYACENLPGFWKTAKASDLVPAMPITSPYAWVQLPDEKHFQNSYTVGYIDSEPQLFFSLAEETLRRCYCTAKQLPRVEYSFCNDFGNAENFMTCVEEKTAAGWYPLSNGTPVSTINGYASYSQAFWRFAQ